MRISKEIFVNVKTVEYSPCGKFLALPYSNQLRIIRTSDGVDIFNVQCLDRITSVDWSVDSDHILCVIATGSVEAFAISSPEWTCSIHPGAVGFSSAIWSPKGTHIVIVAEFAVRLSVWSLIGRSVAFIENLLMKPKEKLSFSPDGESLAVVTGKMSEYNISIISTFWTEMSNITCTQNITFPSTPLWSPNSLYVSIWETVDLASLTLQIYDVKKLRKIKDFTIEPKNWEPKRISSVVWAPNGQFLLIGCRNEIYVLNYISWSVTGVFRHEKIIQENCHIIREINGQYLSINERPVKFTSIARKLPGITKIAPSRDGALVASICKVLPAVVWIWNLEEFSLLTVVVLGNRITDLNWGRGRKLSISDGSKVILWHSGWTNQICLENNPGIKIRKCVWRPGTGDHFMILTTLSVFMVSDI